MFLLYFPQIIQAGMLYKAIPPLYSIQEGKRNRYFTQQIDIVKFIQNKFTEKYTLSLGKQNLTKKEITKLLLDNADYIYHLEKMANTYSVDPYLFEMVINNYCLNKNKINVDKLNKEIKSRYRFMRVENKKGTIIINGTIDQVNNLVFNDRLVAQCRDLLDIIKLNDSLYYNINGKKKSIYEIMKLYESVSPSDIARYKGLGEMNRKELAESTLYPGSDRTLIRYNIDDVKAEVEAVREYESNPKKILELVGNVTRDNLLE